MTGSDWLAVLILAAGVTLIFALDGLRRFEDRRTRRADHEASHDRLLKELKGQP